MGPKGQRITDRGKGHQEYQDSFTGLGRKHALKDQSPQEGQGGLTRTTGLPGLEVWKVSGPWGSSHKDLGSQGKQGNESGEAVSGSQPLTWGLLTGPENPGGAGGGRPGDPMEELMTGKGEPSGGGGMGGGGGAPEPPRDGAAEEGRGGPGGEWGGGPWGRGFGEELSGLRESEGGVHRGTETHRQERQKEKNESSITQLKTFSNPPCTPSYPPHPQVQRHPVVTQQFNF